tara:strand:- start:4000 stop:4362 length:363 start_codon:yes stop_codon:yes gene_type:complete
MGDNLIITKAFGNRNTGYKPGQGSAIKPASNNTWIITPFRAAMNAGDLAGTKNSGVLSSLPSYNQAGGIGNMTRHFNPGGSTQGKAAYVGDPTFVYDGSDYTRFKKLQAKRREKSANSNQ